MLSVKNLRLRSDRKVILDNVSLNIKPGEIVALMGPNGAGKTSLAQAIMGDKQHKKGVSGRVILDKKNISKLSPDKRAKLGLFLSFQTPVAIPGLKYSMFLKQAYKSVKDKQIEVEDFRILLEKAADSLGLPIEYIDDEVNLKLSGGEMKKMEVLQMLILQPKYAILDEIDSGLDVDSLKLISKIIKKMAVEGMGVLIITHYKRILEHLKPSKVLVIRGGKIVAKGNYKLANDIEKLGYEPTLKKNNK